MRVKCYDPQGREYEKESVDARECCERLGYTMQPVEKVKRKSPAKPKAKSKPDGQSEQVTDGADS